MRKQYLRSNYGAFFSMDSVQNHWQVKLKGIWIPINVRKCIYFGCFCTLQFFSLSFLCLHLWNEIRCKIISMVKIRAIWNANLDNRMQCEWASECEKYFNQMHTYHFDQILSFHRHLLASTLPDLLWKMTELSFKCLFIYDFINFNKIKPLHFKGGPFDTHRIYFN